MMMISLTNKTELLTFLRKDKRQVGEKLADVLDSKNVEVVFSKEPASNPNHIVEREEKDGKTVITFYEKNTNVTSGNREALAAYYLSVEAAKMLIEKKSKLSKEELKTNAECNAAVRYVAYGISNNVMGSGTLNSLRDAIEKDVAELKPASGNSDATEVLAAQGISGLEFVEGRAKKISAKDITPSTTIKEKDNPKKTRQAAEDTTDSVSSVRPRSTLASNDNSVDDGEKIKLNNGTIMTRGAYKRKLKEDFPSLSNDAINKLVAQMPKATTTTSMASTASNSTDMFTINGIKMSKAQAVAYLQKNMPTVADADIQRVLDASKVQNTPTTTVATNPNEVVEFMGQKLPRSTALVLAKQYYPTISDSQLNTLLTPVGTTNTLATNPLLNMFTTGMAGGTTNPLLSMFTGTAGYNPMATLPRSITNPSLYPYANYLNPSQFSTASATGLNALNMMGMNNLGIGANGLGINTLGLNGMPITPTVTG